MKLLLQFVLLAVAAWEAAAQQATPGAEVTHYMGTEASGETSVLIPDALVAGQAIGASLTGIKSKVDCSAECRKALPAGSCRWFSHCDDQAGCWAANGTQLLAHQECQLLTSNCSEPLTVAANGLTGITSGFPVHHVPLQLSGFTPFPAQGISFGDLECPESLQPGTCSLRSPLAAASLCIRTPECRSILVFPNGTDGCSESEAVLKVTGLNPANSYISDNVYTLQVAEAQSQESSFWLTTAEGTVVLPTDAELAAADASLSNATTWKGCIWGNNVVYEGQVLSVLEGFESAEACCRACKADASSLCNVWNWCDPAASTNGTCSYDDTDLNHERVSLNASQCQLRHQELAVPEIGSPPVLLAKGAHVPFSAGAPIAVWAPELPGFKRYVGRSNFANGRYSCEGSSRPQTGECVLQAPAEQLAQECAANATCVAFLLKPGGIVDGKPQLSTFGYLKADADPANWILTPTTIMYVEDTPSASSSSGLSTGAIDTPSASSSSGLSTGAIAGIAVGCAAAVAALAAAAWVLVQHRRRATAAGGLHTAKSNASSSIGGGLPEWGTAGSGTDGYNGGGGKQPWAVQPWPMHPSGSPGSSMAASPFAVASAAAVAASAGTTAHSGGSSGANSYLRQAHLPLVGAGAGQAAALLRAGSAPGRGLSVGSTGAPSGSTLPSAAGSGAEVLAELVQHVAAQDARLLTSSGLHSSGSSDLGQWTIDSLPPRLREWLVPPDQIEFVRWPNGKLVELGQGASAHVYKAIYNGEVVACKEMDLEQSAAMQEAFITEATRLQALRHPNVIAFYGVSLSGSKGIVLMEYAEGRDLHSALPVAAAGTSQRLFSWQRRGKRVAYEIAKALNYLHSRGVIHLDVKSQNVLLTANGAVRLADVGFSRVKDKTFLTHVPLVGTFAWIAPEVLMGKAEVDQSADIFSFGVVLWEIVTGLRPQRGSLRMPVVPDECSQEVCDMILQCLSEEPTQRPTAPQLVKQLDGMLEKRKAGKRAAPEAPDQPTASPLS